jgi:hypothetical protein
VALEGGEPPPLRPPTNRSYVFAVVELVGAGGGKSTILRFHLTGGGGAPTAGLHTWRIQFTQSLKAPGLVSTPEPYA